MRQRFPGGFLLSFLIGFAVIGVDQWSKSVIQDRFGPGAEVHLQPLAGDWFSLAYSQNTGAAFGLFREHPGVLTMVSVLILLGLGYWVSQRADVSGMYLPSLGLIGGGAVGNLIDRARFGFVRDFISVGAWPNFNLADAAIFLGVVLIFWQTMRPRTDSEPNRESVGHHD